MKVMLLAAGHGKRMMPLTAQRPKPLLEVGGQTLIEWHLARLANDGFHEVIINLHHLGEQIRSRLGDGARYGLNIHYSEEPKLLETAGGIVQALPLLGDQPFMVVNGDIWTDFRFSALRERLEGDDAKAALAHLILVPNAAHHPAGDFCLDVSGQVSLNGAPSSRHTFSGISLLHPSLFEGLPVQPQALAPLLRQAIEAGRVTGELHTGLWHDIGTPQRLQALDNALRKAEEKPGESR